MGRAGPMMLAAGGLAAIMVAAVVLLGAREQRAGAEPAAAGLALESSGVSNESSSDSGRRKPAGLRITPGSSIEGEEVLASESRETVTVAVVTGRLVEPGGAPIQASIDLVLSPRASNAPEEPRVARAWSDHEGRFEIGLREGLGGHPASLALEIDDQPYSEPCRHERRVTVTLPRSVQGATVDVGDVVVPLPAIVASGVVRDPDGKPVEDAVVALVRRAGAEWAPAFDLRAMARTRPDGRFVIRGRVAETDLAVIAMRQGRVCVEPAPFDARSRDVVLVMAAAGVLTGSIRGAEPASLTGAPPVSVMVSGPGVRLLSRDRGGPLRDEIEVMLSDRRFFAFSLLPGSYTVRFMAPGRPEPLHVVEGVRVAPGLAIADPRLEDVDLSPFLTTRVVTVVDANRFPIEGARVGVRVSTDPEAGYTRFTTGPDGRAKVVMPNGALEIVVARSWFRSAVLAGVTDDITIALERERSIPVTLELARGTSLPSSSLRFEVEVRMLAAPGQPRPPSSIRGDPRNPDLLTTTPLEGTATVEVADPGLYEIRLWLRKPDAPEHDREPLRLGGPAQVVVSDGGNTPVIITPDPDELRLAIERRRPG